MSENNNETDAWKDLDEDIKNENEDKNNNSEH